MILKYAIALAILLILAAFVAWAFLPARHLPGHRARHLRIRLHPGKGFATIVSLWLRWGRLAARRRSASIRPSLLLRYRRAPARPTRASAITVSRVLQPFRWNPCEESGLSRRDLASYRYLFVRVPALVSLHHSRSRRPP